MTLKHVFLAGACALLLSSPGFAAAQDACFVVSGGSPAQGRTQHLVGLSETVRLSASCEYALRAQGSYTAPGDLATREADFLEVHHHLVSSAGSGHGDPRLIFARRSGRGGEGEQHTLMLRYCAHYLLEERLGFRVVPAALVESTGSGGLRIQRVSPARCGAGRLELRVVRGVGAGLLVGTSPEHTLSVGQAGLELTQGDWSIYAARPGGAVGLRVGVFRSQRVVTPLQNHLRTLGLRDTTDVPALLAARWTPGGPGLLLHPTDFALRSDLLWPELRTAADAGVLWLARRTGDGEPVMLGLVQLEAGAAPAVRLPDSAVRDFMQRAYGTDAARSLVPNSEDWRGVFRDLAMCLTPSYHQAHNATVGAAVPTGSACASFGGLAILGQIEGAGDVPARVCLRHAPQRMRADGMRQELPSEADCFRLAEPGSSEPDPWRVAVAGDRVTLEGTGLCLLIDGSPVEPVEGSDGEYVLHAGLLEVRQGGGNGCGSPQAIARLRLPVFDPEHEWHPVGLYTDANEEAIRCSAAEGLVCPWRAILHDENDTYAFVEPRNELEFRLSTSSPVAAAVDHANGGARQLTQGVTVLSGVRGELGGSPAPAVVAYATRDSECPTETFQELRERPPLDVDDLLTDATFSVFLLAVSADDAPTTCLARARFRTRSSRALVAETVGDALGFEVGVLGDAQAVFFASAPVAMGVMLPLGWFRFTPGIRFLALEISANVTMAASFPQGGIVYPDAYLSRVGASLSWALSIGIPEYLPRILSVGGMLHGAATTHRNPGDNPIVSFYVGLNLSTLVDLAGGR